MRKVPTLPSYCYVVGLARSGLRTAKWLQQHSRLLAAWDDNKEQRTKAIELGIPVISPEHAFSDKTLKPNALILSPGIPHTHNKIHKSAHLARLNNCEIIGDIELFYRAYPSSKIIGITGTNGKSTTTALMAHTFNYCGVKALIAGNFGIPCFDLCAQTDPKTTDAWFIFELSSYQLELTPSLIPKIMILLNITPDHLDRYSSFSSYAAAKLDIFKRLKPTEFALIGTNTDFTKKLSLCPPVHGFTIKDLPFSLDTCSHLTGIHNKENATAVYLTCSYLGFEKNHILKAFELFPGLAHRQELVTKTKKFKVINDSKATSFEAASKATSSFSHIHWIVGGLSKDDSILQCKASFPAIDHIYFFGKDGKKLQHNLNKACDSSLFKTLEEATLKALEAVKNAPYQSTILLSPGCASFDQFKNFEYRGDFFKNLIHSLQ